MIRNLKALGLALVAVFALSAVAASGASAHTPAKFTLGEAGVTLSSKAQTKQVFSEGAATEVTCNEINVDPTIAGTEPTSIAAEPNYSGDCTLFPGGFEAKVDPNGCTYVFTAGNATEGEVHIVCPAGKAIEVTAKIAGVFVKCLDIGEQTPTVAKVDYTNETEVTEAKNVWDVRIKSTVEGVTYTKTGACGSGTFHGANYSGEVTVWGTKGGKPVNVTWDKTVA